MPKKHLKRLAAPRTWNIERKTTKFIARPLPGKHPFRYAITLNEVLKSIGVAETRKDVVNILKNNEVFVDNRIVKEVKFNVGLMDVLSIPEAKLFLRITLSPQGLLTAVEIPEKEANLKLCKVVNKTLVKKGKIQLNLHDGRNLIYDKNDIKTGDSVVVDLKDNKIREHVKMSPKTKIMLIGGSNIGKIGVLKAVDGNSVVFDSDGEEHHSVKKNVFCLGSVKVR